MSNKLHEILAIEQDRKNKSNQTIGEVKKVFSKNFVAFDGMIKKYVSMEEFAEQIPDERKEIVFTVKELMTNCPEPVIVAMT